MALEQNDWNDPANAPDEGEESYSFIEEHVKKRPLDRRKLFRDVLRIVLAGALFGAAAGLVFFFIVQNALPVGSSGGSLLTEAPDVIAVASPTPEPEEDVTAIAATSGASTEDAANAQTGSDKSGNEKYDSSTDNTSETKGGKNDSSMNNSSEKRGGEDGSSMSNTSETKEGKTGSSTKDSSEKTETGDGKAGSSTKDNSEKMETGDGKAGSTTKESSDKKESKDGKNASSSKNNGKDTSAQANDKDGEPASAMNLTPTPTPTVEELETEALRSYERVQAAFRRISAETLRHMAIVTSTHSAVSGIFSTGEADSTSSALILGRDNRRIFLLLDHLPAGDVHQVTFANGASAAARLCATDPTTNLTVLTVLLRDLDAETRATLTPAELGNSYSLKNGDLVLAVGAPLGIQGEYCFGSVMSTEHPYYVTDREYGLLTTSMQGAANASGFLVDTRGSIVGIFADRLSPEGTTVITAIPISAIKTLLTKLMNGEELVSFGIMGRDISLEEGEKLSVPDGIYVLYAAEDSAALEAGIRMGDIITTINGKMIKSLRLLEEELYRHKVGDSLTVTILRPGPEDYVEITCEVVLDALEAE